MEPKKRKLNGLNEVYQIREDLMRWRIRFDQRIAAIDAGRSVKDRRLFADMKNELHLDAAEGLAEKWMIHNGQSAGPIWEWVTSIKGLGAGGLAAQLLAEIDDISSFDTISKLWRFAGWAVIDGKAERRQKGEKAHYNNRLKAVCWNIAEQFIRHQTPVYVDYYYKQKTLERAEHPVQMCEECSVPWDECCDKKRHRSKYSDMHIHRMAKRKMIKLFLSHLWVKWREIEGLPTERAYVHDVLGHTHIIEPG